MEMLTKFIPIIISLFGVFLSIYLFRRTEKSNLIPVLIFARISKGSWQIKNVGKGVAMSVIVAEKETEDKWGLQISFYPIASNGEIDVPFTSQGKGLVATYKDIKGNEYSTVCDLFENRFYETNKFPELNKGIDEQSFRDLKEDYRKTF